jgi:carbon monoxide dehydrogenase subunit G
MPIDRFRHAFRVAAPPAAVYAHLMDPHSYVGLSPLVVAVRDIHQVRDDQGRPAIGYVAVERFRFGPLAWDNPIRVTMTGAAPDRRVRSAVVSPGAVRLTATVDLAPDGDGTAVTESVEVRSPLPLRRFVLGRATSVQRRRAEELTRRMTSLTDR